MIESFQSWPGVLAFQHGQLLPESGNFQAEVMPRAKKRTEPMKEGKKEPKHSIILQEQRAIIDESAGRSYLAEFTAQVGFGDAQSPAGPASGDSCLIVAIPRLTLYKAGPRPATRCAWSGRVSAPPETNPGRHPKHSGKYPLRRDTSSTQGATGPGA